MSQISRFGLKESLVDKRDTIMVDGLIEILQKEEVDNLLVNVGKAHMPGITRILPEKLELKEADN